MNIDVVVDGKNRTESQASQPRQGVSQHHNQNQGRVEEQHLPTPSGQQVERIVRCPVQASEVSVVVGSTDEQEGIDDDKDGQEHTER